jgi:bla regulator protein blaR1
MAIRRNVLLLAMSLAASIACQAQTDAVPDWQTAAGGKLSFEVASVRQDTSGVFKRPSMAISAEDGAGPADGLFHADFSLIDYIEFAYKIWPSGAVGKAMVANLPKWVTADRYLIEARAEGQPTKDQVRLMMQSLIAGRFGLKAHFETQTLPVLKLQLIEPGKLGPRIRPNAQGTACDAPEPPKLKDGSPDLSVFPYVCGSTVALDRPDRGILLGSRNTTPATMASSFGSFGWVGETVVDQTGLTGKFDYTLEWTREPPPSTSPDTESQPEQPGTSFFRAVKEQLGMKLVSTKLPVQVLIIDHVERPSEN